MTTYSFENLDNQMAFFNSIKEDYLFNFSLTLDKPLIGPHMLQLILTTKCNLRCKMCGVWKIQEEELDSFYVKKLIDDTYKMGNLKEVYFTGGEALLRKDIFDLIKYVNDFYPNLWTTVNTNGTLLTRQMIDRLIDSELRTLSISIDSPVAKIHNALRGEGVFERVVEMIEYLNAEKKRRNAQYPLLDTCSVLMEQTLDTMYDMLDFCVKYRFSGIHIQPYVCNSDLRGIRDDKFWIHKERLPLLRDVVERMENRKNKLPMLYIEVPAEKIYKYFSEPIFVDRCYAGFTRAIIVGKKIGFVCNGPNNEKHQHLGMGDKDSINEVWFSEKANYFRETIKACKRNCVQFCSIRPSSDSVTEIHQRLAKPKNLFLLFRELHFLEEYILRYPNLPIKGLINSDYDSIRENLEGFLNSIGNLKLKHCTWEQKNYLSRDLESACVYLKNADNGGYSLFRTSFPEDRNIASLDISAKIDFCRKLFKNMLTPKKTAGLLRFFRS